MGVLKLLYYVCIYDSFNELHFCTAWNLLMFKGDIIK